MRERQADPMAQPPGTPQPTVHPSGTWCCSAGSEGDAASGPAGIGAAPAPAPLSLLLREEPDTAAPWQRPRCSRQQPLSVRQRGRRCCGERWLLAPACRAGAAQAAVAVAVGPGRGGRAVQLRCSTWARQVRCRQRVPCPALPCPPLPTTASPTGSTATSPHRQQSRWAGVNQHSFMFPSVN